MKIENNDNIGDILRKKEKDKRFLYGYIVIEIIVMLLGIFSKETVKGIPCDAFKYVKAIMLSELGDFCDLVVTCGTITAAVVILCYSVLDCSRMGISNRTIIRYKIGSRTLPLAFMASVVRLPVLKILYYMKYNYFLTIELFWALLLQFIIITFVIWSSSMTATIEWVSKQEIWQYKKQFEIKETDREYLSAWKVNHIQYALQSPEVFSDKAWFLQRILEAPIGIKLRKEMQTEDMFGLTIDSIYTYYFEKIYSACNAMCNNADERQKLYTFFYGEVRRIVEIELKGTEGKLSGILNNEEELGFIISAILNAILMSDVPEAEEVCVYILRESCSKMDRKLKNRQIMYYFLMLDLLSRTDEERENAQYWKQVCDLLEKYDWEWLDAMCYEYWKLIVRQTTIRRESPATLFYYTIMTLKGKAYTSVLMSGIRRYMKGKIME